VQETNSSVMPHAQITHPLVLATPKVINIFREAGVKSLDWTPVDIEE
jgi:hypothetical protein